MPKIKVKYFLTFEEITSKKEEEIGLDGEATVNELLKLLIRKYGHRFENSILDKKKQLNQYIRILVNKKEAGIQTKLEENDEVSIIFLPAGG